MDSMINEWSQSFQIFASTEEDRWSNDDDGDDGGDNGDILPLSIVH